MKKLTMALIGDEHVADPRLLELDRSTRLVFVEAMTWAARYQTDGLISRASLLRLTDHDDPIGAAGALVASGLWIVHDDCWRVPWDSQITAADADRISAKNRERWRRQKAHQRGDHSECNPRYCTKADTNADDTADRGVSNRSETNRLVAPSGAKRDGLPPAIPMEPLAGPTDPDRLRKIVELRAVVRSNVATEAKQAAERELVELGVSL